MSAQVLLLCGNQVLEGSSQHEQSVWQGAGMGSGSSLLLGNPGTAPGLNLALVWMNYSSGHQPGRFLYMQVSNSASIPKVQRG